MLWEEMPVYTKNIPLDLTLLEKPEMRWNPEKTKHIVNRQQYYCKNKITKVETGN